LGCKMLLMLPNEILLYLLLFCDHQTAFTLSRSCRLFANLMNSREFRILGKIGAVLIKQGAVPYWGLVVGYEGNQLLLQTTDNARLRLRYLKLQSEFVQEDGLQTWRVFSPTECRQFERRELTPLSKLLKRWRGARQTTFRLPAPKPMEQRLGWRSPINQRCRTLC
jgi:F-box associated protein